jgi:cobalt-zinc-cadmium efflux system outer membrane protein
MNSVPADPALPLTFSAALELAERNAPLLIAKAAKIDVARSAAIPAGELRDPRLFFFS